MGRGILEGRFKFFLVGIMLGAETELARISAP